MRRESPGYCQRPSCQAHPRSVRTHCPGTHVVVRCGGSSQCPGCHTHLSCQVQYPGTQTCAEEGATPISSSRGAGGCCGTITWLGGALDGRSRMMVVSCRTSRPPQAGRTTSTVETKRSRMSVVRVIVCFFSTVARHWRGRRSPAVHVEKAPPDLYISVYHRHKKQKVCQRCVAEKASASAIVRTCSHLSHQQHFHGLQALPTP
jgi:hypothetical protein